MRRRPNPPEGVKPIPLDAEHGGVTREGIIDFSASINPIGPMSAAIAAYHSAATAMQSYPPAYSERLAARVAEWLDIGPDHLIVGNGSTHLIHLFARTHPFFHPYVAIPTFSEIANAFRLNDRIPYAIELARERGFRLEIEQITRAMNHRADAIFAGRPNSPTGSLIPLALAEDILRECERFHAWCVFDEAFIDFAGRDESAIHIMRSWPARRKRLVIIGSLTKIFAIPGLRIGFLVAPPEVIEALRSRIEPWSVNMAAERVALASLDGADEFVRATRAWLVEEREYLAGGIASIGGIRVFPSAANFLMIEVNEGGDESFGRFMLRQGIAVRDLRTMPGCASGLYRVAVRIRNDNDRLIAAARGYFNRGS